MNSLERRVLPVARVEARQEAEKINQILQVGKSVIEGSNLTTYGKTLTVRDISVTRQLTETVAPRTQENERLWGHIDLTAKVARRFGDALRTAKPDVYNYLDLNKIEIAGLFQDFGRHITHRWLRNEKVAANALRRLGVRSDVLQCIPSVDIYVGKDPLNEKLITTTVNRMSPEARILEIADLYAKRDPNDAQNIKSFSEVMDFHYASRKNYKDYTKLSPLFPSEMQLNSDVIDFSAAVYNRLHVWFAKQGVDLDSERRWIMIEESERR